MRSGKVVVAFLGLIFLSGCDPLNVENAARILRQTVDENTAKVVVAFLTAVNEAQKESKEWRDLANRYRDDFSRFPARTRIEAMAFTDFAITRIKENVGEMERITGLLNKKEYGKAMQAVLALQRAVQGKNVVVGSFYPDKVDIIWKDHFTPRKKDLDLTTVALVGFNFDPSERGKKDWSVEIRDNKGKKLRTAWDHLVISSPYLAQIDVSGGTGASGIEFRPGETRLVVLYQNKAIATVPVTWGERPPPPLDAGNLLTNGGGEDNNKPGFESAPPIGWTCVAPPKHRWYTIEGRHNEPVYGQRLLWPGYHRGNYSELVQVVDVARFAEDIDRGRLECAFEGWIGTWDDRNGDESQIVVEFLDKAGNSLKERKPLDSGRIFPPKNPDKRNERWQKVAWNKELVPPGCRQVRVRLMAHCLGSGDTDSYFDELILTVRRR